MEDLLKNRVTVWSVGRPCGFIMRTCSLSNAGHVYELRKTRLVDCHRRAGTPAGSWEHLPGRYIVKTLLAGRFRPWPEPPL
jgi:hypothetical protein